jgi:hypothetical protein
LYSGTDEAGDDFTFNYSLRGYSEKQNAVLLTVPLMVKYSLPLGSGATTYYASGGLKFGIPVSAKASISPGTVTTSGYYSFEDGTYTDLPQYGLNNMQKVNDRHVLEYQPSDPSRFVHNAS